MDPYVSLARIIWFLRPEQIEELAVFGYRLATAKLHRLPQVSFPDDTLEPPNHL